VSPGGSKTERLWTVSAAKELKLETRRQNVFPTEVSARRKASLTSSVESNRATDGLRSSIRQARSANDLRVLVSNVDCGVG
jgi:hypothetical protein